MRRRMLAAALGVLAAMLSALLAPVAWAGDQAGAAAPVTERPAGSATTPVALAHTGLDLTVPTVVGLTILLLGTVLVAWAVLRGSRSRGSHI